MTPESDGGYDGPVETQELAVSYRLDLFRPFYSSDVPVRVFRDDEPVGLIRCKSVDEYEWLKSKLQGVFKPPQAEVRR